MRLIGKALAIVCLVVCCSPAGAAIISDVIFAIDAEAGGSSARFEIPLTSANINGDVISWTLDQRTPLLDAKGNELGVLETADVTYIADPVVTLNFLVSSAGGGAFTVTSANLGFSPLSGATGRASSAVTVTDFIGDGATISGGYPNNDTYRAYYNDPGNIPATGTTFATLTPGISSSPFSSATSSEGYPDSLGGFTSVDENGGSISPVSSMSAQWQFSISAGDSASGTSTFVIVPEPSTCLLGFCAMILVGFIRRK